MSDLRELYQQVIIDHSRKPHHFGRLDNADHIKEGYNPLCGDQLTIYVKEKNGLIEDVSFEGAGCAISMASASLMTDAMKGKNIADFEVLFKNFHELLTGYPISDAEEKLGKLFVLGGVAEFPMRVKCATLCWHTAIAALHGSKKAISTE